MAELPTGTVTFLFTDIEGSTRLLKSLGRERYGAVLSTHNRLLARGPRLRVEGEIVRDVALAASGLLTDRLGGPSVFAPAPG